jgi:hypothetical protein
MRPLIRKCIVEEDQRLPVAASQVDSAGNGKVETGYWWAGPTGEGLGRLNQNGVRPARAPHGIVLAVEEAKARSRLYPITVLYSVYAAAVLTQALRDHAWTALACFTAGAGVGTAVEYWVIGPSFTLAFAKTTGSLSSSCTGSLRPTSRGRCGDRPGTQSITKGPGTETTPMGTSTRFPWPWS